MKQSFLRNLLAYPSTKGLDLDDPRLTELRKSIIKEKGFLKAIYQEWYQLILQPIPQGPGKVLELGSGAGFLPEIYPEILTSEVFLCRNTRAVLDGRALPFPSGSLKAIVMTDVLHHIPAVWRFFEEAVRCLRTNGVIAMVEPWVSPWAQFVYRNLHHEPYDPQARSWDFPSSGPLSGANGALPWILFQRDRAKFEEMYINLKIETLQPMMPFRYLVSGGVSMRSLSPVWTHGAWKTVEAALSPLSARLSMFAYIVLQKTA